MHIPSCRLTDSEYFTKNGKFPMLGNLVLRSSSKVPWKKRTILGWQTKAAIQSWVSAGSKSKKKIGPIWIAKTFARVSCLELVWIDDAGPETAFSGTAQNNTKTVFFHIAFAFPHLSFILPCYVRFWTQLTSYKPKNGKTFRKDYLDFVTVPSYIVLCQQVLM